MNKFIKLTHIYKLTHNFLKLDSKNITKLDKFYFKSYNIRVIQIKHYTFKNKLL